MKTLFTFCFSLFSVFTFSQTAPAIEWQNTIGTGVDDQLGVITATSDGGSLLAGYTDAGLSGDKTDFSKGLYDYWILKLDNSGNIEWQNTIGSNSLDYMASAIQTADGGYFLGGSSYGGIGGDKTEINFGPNDYWLVKVNNAGNIEWQNSIGGSGNDGLSTVIQTSDNGYLIGGFSISGISGDKTDPCFGSADYWVIKLDEAGNIEWQKTLGGSDDDLLYSLVQTSDGGYLLGGSSESGISGNKTEANADYDYWIVKLNSSGIIQWQNTIGGLGIDLLYSVAPGSDGGFILGGSSTSGISGDKTEANLGGFYDYWMVKTDDMGNIEWQNTLGGSGTDFLSTVIKCQDSTYLIGGWSESGISPDKSEACLGSIDNWIVKLNNTGDIIWENTIGGSSHDNFYSLAQTTDKGYIIACTSYSDISGDKTENRIGFSNDYWVVKLYPEVIICSVSTTITASGPVSFCTGENVILHAPVDASYSYQWKRNNINIPGATSSSFTANNTGQYQVYISNGSCDGISDSISVVKNAKPNPTVNNIDATNDLCFDSSIKLKTAAVAGSSYQWYRGGSTLTGATSNVYFATMAGNYKVKVTNSSGCTKNSAPYYSIIKTCRLSEEETASDAAINIYPNPNSGNFTIILPPFNTNETISIRIKNMLGEEVYAEQINTSELNHQISLDKNISEGIYLVFMQTNNKIVSQQIIITK